MIVKGVKEGSVHKRLRPDHRRRLDQVFPHESCDSEANALCRKSQHQIETPAKVLAIKAPLGHNRICEVANTITECCVGHDDNQPMLLQIEGSRIQAPSQTERAEGSGWHDLIPSYT